jgi:hypothetical protein
VGEIRRKLGVSEQTFYRWKKRFGALGVSELRELRQFRDENRKLEGLALHRRGPGRHRSAVARVRLPARMQSNEQWAMDFVHDIVMRPYTGSNVQGY